MAPGPDEKRALNKRIEGEVATPILQSDKNI
jgi:hypothetical protein